MSSLTSILCLDNRTKRSETSPIKSPEIPALKYVSRSIGNLPDQSWPSLEFHEMYTRIKEGVIYSRFIPKLKDHVNEEIYVFSCPGVASIIMLKQKASHLVNAVSETDNDDVDSSMRALFKKKTKNK